MSLDPEILRDYSAARDGVALLARPERGLLEVAGRDRAAWLHNLVTNVVRTLAAGDGVYAFAINIKGRVVFDLNILALDDPANPQGRLWLDIDRGWLAEARKHLERYIITEDVRLSDVSARHARLALLGPAAADLTRRLGVGNLTAMAALQHVPITLPTGAAGRLVRHDLAGVLGAELITADGDAAAGSREMLDAGRAAGIRELSPAAADMLRIEAGIPASRRDIDADVVPPETGQIERGISYHKGCYLGQEVIERMRSHGVVTRRLVGIRFAGAADAGRDVPAAPAALRHDGSDAGRLTSACWSPRLGGPLGLGYVKISLSAPGTRLTAVTGDGAAFDGEIVALPVR